MVYRTHPVLVRAVLQKNTRKIFNLGPAEEVAVVSVRHGPVLEHAVVVLDGVAVCRKIDHVLDHVARVFLADQVFGDGQFLKG